MIGILWWCLFVVALTITYVVVSITTLSALFAALCCTVAVVLLKKHIQKEDLGPICSTAFGQLAIAIGLDLFLLAFFWLVRTDATLHSPWTVSPITLGICIAYGLSTALLLFSFKSVSRMHGTAALVIHFFTTYGVSLLAFRYGFGYDPIIHQTAERYIIEHGRILPLQPFYIGQYSVVAALSLLTRIPVELIDRLLVPVLSSITIPVCAYHGLMKGYGLSHGRALAVTMLSLIYPLSQVTFTVPYNLTVVYAIWWFFLLPCYRRSAFDRGMVYACVAAAMASHPLVGIPMLIATAAIRYVKRHAWISIWVGIISVSVALIAMFGAVRMLAGLSPFDFSLMQDGIQRYVSLFLPYQIPSFPSIFFSVYWYEYFIKNIVPLVTIIFLPFLSIPSPARIGLLVLSVGSYLGIFGFMSLISLPGIVQLEQYEFILRLKDSIGYMLSASLLIAITREMPALPVLKMVPTGIIIAIAASYSLFLTYPQINEARAFAGPNVSKDDISAVAFIEKLHPEKNYVALAPNLQAVVGLRSVGFDRTFLTPGGKPAHVYPISPSEPLFLYADALLNDSFNEQMLVDLKRLTGGRYIYILVPSSWWAKNAVIKEVQHYGAQEIKNDTSLTIYRFR